MFLNNVFLQNFLLYIYIIIFCGLSEILSGKVKNVAFFLKHFSNIGSPTIGEEFDPAKDCSDIVDKLPDAKDGFYWIDVGKDKPQKVSLLVAKLTLHSLGKGEYKTYGKNLHWHR